ncbi:MAG: hypothetical protein ABI619_03605 [Betaproteobacteria bacterium]
MQHGKAAHALVSAVEQALRAGKDAALERAFATSTSSAVFRALSSAQDAAMAASGDAALRLDLFAMPILFVTGGTAPVVLPGVLSDIGELQKLFEAHGTLGAMKNFALAATLVSASGLAALSPSEVYGRAHKIGPDARLPLDLPPEEMHIAQKDEAVHLRFLTGVCVTSPDAPGFAETAGNIGAWGLPVARALAAQLAQPGLSLLPIPRLPTGLTRALAVGLFAQNELRFQLFLTSALRKFRSSIGEAAAEVAACADASIHIRLRSPFDASMAPEFVWHLQPPDDIVAVSDAISSLLEECRVTDIQVAETIQTLSASH